MLYDTKDLSIKARVVVPRGFESWSIRDRIDYILENLKNPMVVLSVAGVTEREKEGRLIKKGDRK